MGEDKPGQRAEAQRLEKEGLTQRSVVLQERKKGGGKE